MFKNCAGHAFKGNTNHPHNTQAKQLSGARQAISIIRHSSRATTWKANEGHTAPGFGLPSNWYIK